MINGIKITVVREPNDDDRLYRYQIRLSNGLSAASLIIWGYDDYFKEFGTRLTSFPKNIEDTVSFELRSESEGHLLLSAICFDAAGKSTVKVIVDNHKKIPEYQRSEFYINAEAASLNRLGEKLASWSPSDEKEMSWISSTGY